MFVPLDLQIWLDDVCVPVAQRAVREWLARNVITTPLVQRLRQLARWLSESVVMLPQYVTSRCTDSTDAERECVYDLLRLYTDTLRELAEDCPLELEGELTGVLHSVYTNAFTAELLYQLRDGDTQ